MITIKKESIFNNRKPDMYLINPVNIIGVMGKGLALLFKNKYPTYFRDYKNKCDSRLLEMGKVSIYEKDKIISFPTKKMWWDKSYIEDIEEGLKDLLIQCDRLNIKSIGMPQIGCGLGGLNFENEVLPLIKSRFNNSNIDIDIFIV